MDEPAAIEIEELHFAYPGSDFELHLAHWSLPAGGRVALHGSSGCGKSTLLNLIAGVLVPSRGRLSVHGRDLVTMSDAQRRAWRIQRMGFIFQDFPLVSYLDAVENVLLPYRINPALRLDRGARERARGRHSSHGREYSACGMGMRAHHARE